MQLHVYIWRADAYRHAEHKLKQCTESRQRITLVTRPLKEREFEALIAYKEEEENPECLNFWVWGLPGHAFCRRYGLT